MNPDYETMILLLLAVSLAAALIAVWSRFKPIWEAGNAVKQNIPSNMPQEEEPEASSPSQEDDEEQNTPMPLYRERRIPKASVVVFTFTEEEEILSYLQMAMSQDYPDYEIILVNEGGAETTSELAERLKALYPERLYVTFIPDDSRNLSRRKLALTVGIKAASGDVIITTTSNCVINSRRWLSEIMQPFADDSMIDVVLGYSHVDFASLHGAGKWYRQMNATLTSCQWIGAAHTGHPFRGDSNNLAFKKHLFFECKGYSKTIHLVNGDDDLFLNEIMNPYNTTTAISPDSILVTEWGESANRILADIRERYQFTARFLPYWPFLRSGLGSFMQWLMVLSALAASLGGFMIQSVIPLIAAFVIVSANWTAEVVIYRRTARRLGSVCLWWSFPWFLLWHPIGNLIFKIKCGRRIRKNYTFS